ncbi:hypothetical protein RISK_001647 [Rhodopirellula islandica]|uniref:Uncharacterized protein n=1 Tax=Rhodopirellula islandica TaxID=595434 RepID=A0A0J1BIS4_RHOIS|nr:hypothetical protein RISK_001647 [Rhodopirellula islandica]
MAKQQRDAEQESREWTDRRSHGSPKREITELKLELQVRPKTCTNIRNRCAFGLAPFSKICAPWNQCVPNHPSKLPRGLFHLNFGTRESSRVSLVVERPSVLTNAATVGSKFVGETDR